MFDKIVYISNEGANVKIKDGENLSTNIMNMHLVFEDDKKKILGEVDDIDDNVVKAHFLGELLPDRFIGGVIRKPDLNAKVRIITPEEMKLIVGDEKPSTMTLGASPLYDSCPIKVDINELFSNHMAIFGNSGSGKSCGVSRLIQNVFQTPGFIPFRSNFFIFDSSGEYRNAFQDINKINPNYNYKFYTTNYHEPNTEQLKVPLWLLTVDDLALLLSVTNHSQLPIIERMHKLVRIFNQGDVNATEYKNHIIAKAIMTVLYSNETSTSKRNDIFSIIGSCSTEQFNLEAELPGIGYTRKFRDCFLIDSEGNFTESVLLTKYVSEFIKPELDNFEPAKVVYYTLEDLEKALNFTLISEGWLRNENTYGDAVTIRVRLHSLITGDYAKFFACRTFMSEQQFIASLIMMPDGKHKAQIVNFNLDDVDDSFAKTITKIFCRILFDFTKSLKDRGSLPFNILLEEAHRYIQNDTDTFILGYNIFDRIAKEGRKYGLIMSLISQRPVEISDTVISQCSNFLIFKMNHPRDLDYIKKMVPNISEEIVEKQKTLQPGTCMAFGSAFRIPMIVRMEMPNPQPYSANADVFKQWTAQ
ncbi:MAG: ATP-binding protein [Candidatus Faecenecus gallistercoris]|nr:ATP-binding protein [Bacillota bacterium]MDD7102518.1 ATP-binding protein [Bacillota bacterium]MDY4050765.1 ATP-binding protein [Candidatus Faecenecus gallistercoris]